MNKYYYAKHGLLFIVVRDVDTGMDIIPVEDSRWTDEEQAKEHCRLLNLELEEESKTKKNES